MTDNHQELEENLNNVNNLNNNVENANIVIENPIINNRVIQQVRNAINQGENFHNVLINIRNANHNIHNFNNENNDININNINNINNLHQPVNVIAQQERNRRFNILSLRNAREIAGFDNFITFDNFQNIINRNYQLNQADLSIAYLNYLCAFGDVEMAERWTENFANIYGRYALFVLVNSPMIVTPINYQTFPLFTAAFWGNLGMVRLLCELGAQINTLDQFNYYAEEAVLHTNVPYVNPVGHLFNTNVNWNIPPGNYRNYDEFVEVIREIRIIAGETLPPINWLPIRFRLNNHV